LKSLFFSGYVVSEFTYTYDDVGNRLTMTKGQSTQTYGYDDIYQLTSVTGAQSHSYDYDDVHNREEADGVSYSVNDLNQYTEVDTFEFDYDSRGNLISDGVNTYSYDYENRLDSVFTATDTVSYTYDPFGRRISKTTEGETTYYVYDGDHVIAEYDGDGTQLREYLYGSRIDEVISMLDTDSSTRYFYFADGLGSVSEVIDLLGVVKEKYEYSPYGKTTVKNRYGQTLPETAIGNSYGFTGRRLDYETGLYHYRARTYSAGLGRFMQRDPLGYVDGMNLFAYVRNNPVNWVDSFGLSRSFGSCLKRCALDHYGLGDLLGRGASWGGMIPLPKRLLKLPILGEASPFTNPISYFGHKVFPNARLPFRIGLSPRIFRKIGLGPTTRIFGILGRANLAIGAGLAVYDMISIGLCVKRCREGEGPCR